MDETGAKRHSEFKCFYTFNRDNSSDIVFGQLSSFFGTLLLLLLAVNAPYRFFNYVFPSSQWNYLFIYSHTSMYTVSLKLNFLFYIPLAICYLLPWNTDLLNGQEIPYLL